MVNKRIFLENRSIGISPEDDSAIKGLNMTFGELRRANVRRLGHYEKCLDWAPSQWFQAMVGEVGEYANFRKKYERGDLTLEEFKTEAAKELADVQIYLDLLAHALDIDLGQAARDKFNEVSDRIGSDVKL